MSENSGLKGRMSDFGFEVVKSKNSQDKENNKNDEGPTKGKTNQRK